MFLLILLSLPLDGIERYFPISCLLEGQPCWVSSTMMRAPTQSRKKGREEEERENKQKQKEEEIRQLFSFVFLNVRFNEHNFKYYHTPRTSGRTSENSN